MIGGIPWVGGDVALLIEVTTVVMNFGFRFYEQQTFLSSSNAFSVYFRRTIPTLHKSESEYVDGAYTFLDGKIS